MTTINYTIDAHPASSLVDGIYYNENTQELTVDLDDDLYTYKGVPVDEFHTFVAAPSAGKHYGGYFKRTYGPANKVGVWDDANFVRVSKPRTDTVGTPKDLTVSSDRLTQAHISTGAISDNIITPNEAATYVTNTTNTFTLSAPVESKPVRTHTVKFAVDGVEKAHNVKVESVDEAVAAVNEIADMLDLTFVIKSVTVNFE